MMKLLIQKKNTFLISAYVPSLSRTSSIYLSYRREYLIFANVFHCPMCFSVILPFLNNETFDIIVCDQNGYFTLGRSHRNLLESPQSEIEDFNHKTLSPSVTI